MIFIRLFILSQIFLCVVGNMQGETTYVTSEREFDGAHDRASPNDSIIWQEGNYSNLYLGITADQLNVTAEMSGSTVFTGTSKVEIRGDHVSFSGFKHLDGDIGYDDVVSIRGSHILITQVNIRAYRLYKYLRVLESSQYVYITCCNFENRLNLDDQNILSTLVDANQLGYHKIQHCSFKKFVGTVNDFGIEPIRISLNTQVNRNSRTLVEDRNVTSDVDV